MYTPKYAYIYPYKYTHTHPTSISTPYRKTLIESPDFKIDEVTADVSMSTGISSTTTIPLNPRITLKNKYKHLRQVEDLNTV